jgi:hypothetical protein
MAMDCNMQYGNKKTIFLELSSYTPHVFTAMVAALGVSLHGLWRNVLMHL